MPLFLSLPSLPLFQEVKKFVTHPLLVPFFKCHTQAVDRAIRIVTEAESAVIGPEARDGFIRQRMRYRKEVGRFDPGLAKAGWEADYDGIRNWGRKAK